MPPWEALQLFKLVGLSCKVRSLLPLLLIYPHKLTALVWQKQLQTASRETSLFKAERVKNGWNKEVSYRIFDTGANRAGN